MWRQECADGDGDVRVTALQACVQALPERSRALLQRACEDDPGRPALGAEFGLRPDGVKTALRRLRQALRECIERRLRGEA